MAERQPPTQSADELLGALMRTLQSWRASAAVTAIFSGFALEAGMVLMKVRPSRNVAISLQGEAVAASELHTIIDDLTARLSERQSELPAVAHQASGEAALARAVALHTLIDAIAPGGN